MKCYLIFDASHVLLYCLSLSSSGQVLVPVFFALGVRNRETSSAFVLKTLLRYYRNSSMLILIVFLWLITCFNIIYLFQMSKKKTNSVFKLERICFFNLNKYIYRNQVNCYIYFLFVHFNLFYFTYKII